MMRTIRRALARRGERPDAGVAMVVVLGIMLVGAIITTTLAYVTLYNTKNTVKNRMEMRALQSADAGLDLVLSLLEGKKYSELNSVCSQTFTINNDTVAVTTSYTVTRAGSTVVVACPLSTDITQSVLVTSKATTSAVPLNNGGKVTRTVAAVFAPTPPDVILDKAIFSEGSTTLTNNTQLIASGAVDALGNPIADANVYANGSITCMTQVDTGGKIYAAQGSLDLQNDCDVANSVWARDWVKLSSQASVNGDVYAAAVTPLSQSTSAAGTINVGVAMFNNTSLVTGNVLTNSGIYLQDSRLADGGGIQKSAFARTGYIVLDPNQASIGGSAYSGAGIWLSTGGSIGRDAYVTVNTGKIQVANSNNKIGGNAIAGSTIDSTSNLTVVGTKKPNTAVSFPAVPNPASTFPAAVGYPTNIQPPAREQMPQLALSDPSTELTKWTGAGWTVKHTSNCTGTGPATFINANATSGAVMIFFDCTSTQPVLFDNATLTLGGNVALVSNTGFTSSNDLKVYSSDTTKTRQVYWIVPSNASNVTWTAVSGGQTHPSCSGSTGNITINKMGLKSIQTMMYSPCNITWSNGFVTPSDNFVGQMYGGSVTIPNALYLKMLNMPIPSLSTTVPSLTDATNMRLTSRYDVRS